MRQPRLVVIDVLRGFFLFAIIVDHIRLFPNILMFLTGGTYLWVSFDSGFFIVSGFIFAYLNNDVQKPFFPIVKKAWSRSIKLFLWSIFLTILFTLWGNLIPFTLAKGGLWEIQGNNWVGMLVKTMSFKYVYGWHDFLPYYSIFMLFAPLVILGLRRFKTWLVLGFSFLIWCLRGTNVYMAQQIIFVTGMVLGYNYGNLKKFYLKLNENKKIFLHRIFVYGFVVSFAICLLSTFFLKDILLCLTNLGSISQGLQIFILKKNAILNLLFDKNTLGIGRLLLIPIWLGALYIFFCKNIEVIRRLFGGVLEYWGRNSLAVYIFHAVVVYSVPMIAASIALNGFISDSITTALLLVLIDVLIVIKVRTLPKKTIFD